MSSFNYMQNLTCSAMSLYISHFSPYCLEIKHLFSSLSVYSKLQSKIKYRPCNHSLANNHLPGLIKTPQINGRGLWTPCFSSIQNVCVDQYICWILGAYMVIWTKARIGLTIHLPQYCLSKDLGVEFSEKQSISRKSWHQWMDRFNAEGHLDL